METANPINEQQPVERRFKIGDIVCWTNDNGLKWHARRIIGLDDPDKWGHRYYLEPTDAPWMYTREKNLSLETLDRDTLEKTLPYDYSLRKFCERHPHYLSEVTAVTAAQKQHPFAIGHRFTFAPGQAVTCNGYPGTVKRMYSEGMVEVRVPGGLVCVSASYPDCYPNTSL